MMAWQGRACDRAGLRAGKGRAEQKAGKFREVHGRGQCRPEGGEGRTLGKADQV